MSTVALKIIFTGLVGFSLPQPGEEFVAAFVEDKHHEAKLYLLEGSCGSPEQCETAGWTLDGCGKIWALGLDGLTISVVDGLSGGGLDIARDRRPEAMVPRDPDEARAISWVPSMNRIILSPREVRMEESCRDFESSCSKASARFFMNDGKVSSCHFIHDEHFLLTYEVERHGRQALADAVALEEEIRGELLLRSSEDEWWITPSADDKITLVAGSFAVQRASVGSGEPLSHFAGFYPLTNQGIWPLTSPVPRNPLPFRSKRHFGSCEDDLKGLYKRTNCSLMAAAHLPGKCDTATYP